MVDVDKDGPLDMVTMSDWNNLRWDTIPKISFHAAPGVRHDIARAPRRGRAARACGDIAGKGFVDVVRRHAPVENVKGDGTERRQHPLGPFPRCRRVNRRGGQRGARGLVDLNGDGRNDVVQSVEEFRPATIADGESRAGDEGTDSVECSAPSLDWIALW